MRCYNLENEIKTKHIEAVFKLESVQKKKKLHISPVACSATHATHLSGCEFLTLPGFS